MRLLRFLRHFALNCLNYLTFLTRTLNLIMSLLFPTFVLFPISACSFFDNLTVSTQPVPFFFFLFLFGLSLYKFACLFLCFLVYFFIQACIFLSTLYLFIHNLSQKIHNPCFFLPSSVRALFCIIIFQFFSFMHIHLHAQKTATPFE